MPSGLKDLALDVVGVALPADRLDDHARPPSSARFEYFQRTSGANGATRRRNERAQVVPGREIERRPVRARFAWKAGAVRQELLDRDGRVLGLGGDDLEPREVLRDGVVQAQLALLPKLHHGRRREELAVRRHPEPGRRSHPGFRCSVSEAEAGGPHQVLIGHDAHRDARQPAFEHLTLQPGAEQSLGAQHIGVRPMREAGDCANSEPEGTSAIAHTIPQNTIRILDAVTVMAHPR